MRRIIFFFIFLLNGLLSSAETICHTSGDFNNLLPNSYDAPTTNYYVKVFFHVIRDSNGGGVYSFPKENISDCIQKLNSDYNFHTTDLVHFEYAGMDYINNTEFYNISSYGSFESQIMFTTNRHQDAIDVYLLPIDSHIAGFAEGIPGTALAIGGHEFGSALASSSVLSHEMGHCLGLFHTFHGGASEPYHSSPDCAFSNSSIRGDFIGDTEADPFPLYDHVMGCAWYNTTEYDQCGQLFMPDTRQIMADIPAECMMRLTFGQGDRVRMHISTQQMLQNRIRKPIAYVQNRQFAGSGEEIIMANDSIIAGYNVTTGSNGYVEIPSGGDVTFKTGKKVLLKPGFKVNLGAKFHTEIGALPQTNQIQARHNETTESDYIPMLENSSWTVIYHNTGNTTRSWAYVYKNIGDSIIDGKKYCKIKQHYLSVDASMIINEGAHYLLYENTDTRRVYWYDTREKQDMLLFDFSLQIGDICPSSMNFILKDISSVEKAGHTRKQYTFVHDSDTIVWVEGIGNYTTFLYPSMYKCEEMRLLCVQKDGETVYDTGKFLEHTCDEVNQICEDQSAEAINTTETPATPSATKILRDGLIYILRGEKEYTLTGQEVTR